MQKPLQCVGPSILEHLHQLSKFNSVRVWLYLFCLMRQFLCCPQIFKFLFLRVYIYKSSMRIYNCSLFYVFINALLPLQISSFNLNFNLCSMVLAPFYFYILYYIFLILFFIYLQFKVMGMFLWTYP